MKLTPLPRTPHVRVLSLSSPVAAGCPRRFERAMVWLGQTFEVSSAPHARSRSGHTVASAEERARDLVDAWFDPSVHVLLSVIGGATTAQLIEHLPLEAMAERPKLMVGYSDTTSLLSVLHTRGIPSLYGPALLPQLGEFGGPHAYVVDAFLRCLRPAPLGEVPPFPFSYQRYDRWDTHDDQERPLAPTAGRRCVREGLAAGPLFVANLGTLLSLAGTPYFPDLSGFILIVEEDESESKDSIERMLHHLRMLGVPPRLAGLAFGRMRPEVGMPDDVLADALLRCTRGTRIPVAINLEVGHVDPFHALPLGVAARLSCAVERVELHVHESIWQPPA
jgi:muramoyltetrapeptide carboxypeptidase